MKTKQDVIEAARLGMQQQIDKGYTVGNMEIVEDEQLVYFNYRKKGWRGSVNYRYDVPPALAKFPAGTYGEIKDSRGVKFVRKLIECTSTGYRTHDDAHSSNAPNSSHWDNFRPIVQPGQDSALLLACKALTEFDTCVGGVCPYHEDCDGSSNSTCIEMLKAGFKKEAEDAR